MRPLQCIRNDAPAASSPENTAGTFCLESQTSLQEECGVWIPLGDPACSFPAMDSRSPCPAVLA